MTLSIGLLSTYPPTECGIATFSRSLLQHLRGAGAHAGVVRVVADDQLVDVRPSPPEVVGEWRSRHDLPAAVAALNRHDVVVVQHEYGIYPGLDGEQLLDALDDLEVPVVTVLHTVVQSPTVRQRLVLEGIADRSAALITMTRAARTRLLRGYDVEPRLVGVVPHGAPDHSDVGSIDVATPTVLTWGLLGPGKGVEWAIAAMAELADLSPRPLYRVVGQTHPRILERDGTAYQDMLAALARDLGLGRRVAFDHRYLPPEALRGVVADADVVVLPYDSVDQVTSGVLIEAVAAGKPVVATRFPHAEELLATGAGITVPHRDPGAIAAAVRRVLTEPGLARRMSDEAMRLAPGLRWSRVATRYLDLAHSLTTARTAGAAP